MGANGAKHLTIAVAGLVGNLIGWLILRDDFSHVWYATSGVWTGVALCYFLIPQKETAQ